MSRKIPANILREQKTLFDSRQLKPGQESFYRIWQDYASPYSHKVMSYMNYKGIPYKRMQTTLEVYMGEIVELVGQSIIPVLLTPDEQIMQDSTAILEWFEKEYNFNSAIPEDEMLAYLMWLLEEFADEYMPRMYMHTRWGNEQNRRTISHRIARGFSFGNSEVSPGDIAPMLLERQSGFCQYLGLTGDSAQKSMDRQILELLSILEEHFKDYQFLLGFKPSLADFSFYGPLRIHLFNDPQSNEIMEINAPRTCRWMDTISEFGDSRGCVGQTEFGDWIDLHNGLPHTLEHLLRFIGKTYIPFAHACAIVSGEKKKYYGVNVDGVMATFSTHQYRVWSFEQLQLRFQALSDISKETIGKLLPESEIPRVMLQEVIHNGLYDGFTPPFIKNGVCDARVRHLKEKENSG